MADSFYYVRLKPLNESKNHKLKRYYLSPERAMFEVDKGWYRVSERIAKKLQHVRQRTHDEESPRAFEIISETEKKRRDRKVREDALHKLTYGEVIASPEDLESDLHAGRGDLTLDDLPIPDDEDDDEPQEPQELGVSMANSKAELLDTAQALGLDVDDSMKKAEILQEIKRLVEQR